MSRELDIIKQHLYVLSGDEPGTTEKKSSDIILTNAEKLFQQADLCQKRYSKALLEKAKFEEEAKHLKECFKNNGVILCENCEWYGFKGECPVEETRPWFPDIQFCSYAKKKGWLKENDKM